jgi:hypothetical protein
MKFEIKKITPFEKELKALIRKYVFLKAEYAELLGQLKENPTSGIPLGRDCYKIRLSIASKGKGKRGRKGNYLCKSGKTHSVFASYI